MNYNKLTVATLAALSLTLGACVEEHNHDEAHWSYQGDTGPAHWGSLSEKFALCGTGQKQSPVDITDSVKADLPPLQFNYSLSQIGLELNDHNLYVHPQEDHENSQQKAELAIDKLNTLSIGDETYQLLQFHPHTPSEEAINGERADLVVHLVHQNAKKQLAVVAVLFKQGEEANPALAKMWEGLSQSPNSTETEAHETKEHEVSIDANQLLPEDKNYYTLEGSLTTPPCSEGVKWVVLKQPMSISAEQLALYKKVFSHNARPLQPLNDRKVLSSD
jgi:carbonic anhydrase